MTHSETVQRIVEFLEAQRRRRRADETASLVVAYELIIRQIKEDFPLHEAQKLERAREGAEILNRGAELRKYAGVF